MPIPDDLFTPLNAFLSGRMGLHFAKERRSDLERAMAAAATEFGLDDVAACVKWLISAAPTRETMGILSSHLTVGETYFFRDRKIFDALEQVVLPDLIRSHSTLRIWSAGCCTGEEPYSIAMLLDRLAPGHDGISILATDVNPRFLEKANRGLYSEWSFRGAPAWVTERHFRRVGQGYELSRRISEMVKFSRLNLAEDPYPEAMNLVFCRNVLMYFSPDKAAKLAHDLHRATADDGWLVVSPAEASNELFSGFAPVDFPGAMMYRRRVPEVSKIDDRPAQETMPVDEPAERPAPEIRDEVDACAMARLCADRGSLGEARRWCEVAIESDRLNAQCHYLLATIMHEMGEFAAEKQALKRTVYIDPDFALAHFALGNVRLHEGRCDDAERHFSNALLLLQAIPRDEILPESGGMAAGRLVEAIKSARAGLERAAGGEK
jgi:chemotaxis protein methyltransferase CheR